MVQPTREEDCEEQVGLREVKTYLEVSEARG